MTKNKNINRLMFWFRDKNDELYEYTVRFVPLALLLNRLINEEYTGKKIKFLNINFKTQQSFDPNENNGLNCTHTYGGHLQHNAIFARDLFDKKPFIDQKKLIWDSAYEALKMISKNTNNYTLAKCCEPAYKKGLESNLNVDFIMLESISDFDNKKIKVELWAEFEGDRVLARLIIFRNNDEVYNKVIDSTKSDNEFFYTIFKKIIFDPMGWIILKGHYEIDYLPLKIKLENK